MNFTNITNIEKITGDKGYISTNNPDMGKITFYAKLPKSAVIKTVKLDGVFLEDILVDKKIEYYREHMDGELKVVGTVDFGNALFENEYLKELVHKIDNYVIQEFDVYYEVEAVVEV